MAIAEGLGALKSAFDIGHAINQRIREGKLYPNEIADQLLQLQQLIIDSQRALNDAAEEIRELKEQLATLQRDDEIVKDLEYISDGGFYSRKSERESGTVVAYCPLCWGDAKKLVPLNPREGKGNYFCAIHKSSYSTAAFRSRQAQQRDAFNRRNSW